MYENRPVKFLLFSIVAFLIGSIIVISWSTVRNTVLSQPGSTMQADIYGKECSIDDDGYCSRDGICFYSRDAEGPGCMF